MKPFDFAKLTTSSTVCCGVDVPASKTSLASGFARSGDHETAIMTRTINTVVQRWRLTMSYGHARSLNTLPVVVNGRCMPSSQRREDEVADEQQIWDAGKSTSQCCWL